MYFYRTVSHECLLIFTKKVHCIHRMGYPEYELSLTCSPLLNGILVSQVMSLTAL